jgi:hypothetical protein
MKEWKEDEKTERHGSLWLNIEQSVARREK